MVGPKDETKVKTIYKQTVNYFPSKEIDLYKLIADMQTQTELTTLKMEYEYSKQLTAANESIMKAQHETVAAQTENQLLRSEMKVQALMHQNEILELKLSKLNLG
jgi:hypothetical protein